MGGGDHYVSFWGGRKARTGGSGEKMCLYLTEPNHCQYVENTARILRIRLLFSIAIPGLPVVGEMVTQHVKWSNPPFDCMADGKFA